MAEQTIFLTSGFSIRVLHTQKSLENRKDYSQFNPWTSQGEGVKWAPICTFKQLKWQFQYL